MSQPDLVVRWKNSEGLLHRLSATVLRWLTMHNVCDEYLQLRLHTDSLASGIEISGCERSGAEVRVVAADSVGGRDTCDQEAGEDGCGAGDGRHF
jgi:hypothetical protein